jgi:glycosyltransferase involved in cell wall biosynthesis
VASPKVAAARAVAEAEALHRDDPRVALVSVGIGRVQRGFERYIGDLFQVLRGELDLTLYKSGGRTSSRERVPALLGPTTALVRALPTRRLGGAEYKRDCLAFGLLLALEIRFRRYDVVHVIDPPLAVALQRLRRLAGLDGTLLFTEGTAMPPERYPHVDHLHHVALPSFDRAVAAGVPEEDMTFVPCGLHTERFASARTSREALRSSYGVSESTFVVLVVSAVKREHKRVDHVINEVSRLGGDVLLWIDGNPEDPEVFQMARLKLGERCRITHVPSAQVGELYLIADVLVHASLSESFGLAIVEALASGLPVLAHDAPHFEWLIGDRTALVDMRQSRLLARRLRELRGRRRQARQGAFIISREVQRRFDWSELKTAYLDMYRRVALGSRRGDGRVAV